MTANLVKEAGKDALVEMMGLAFQQLDEQADLVDEKLDRDRQRQIRQAVLTQKMNEEQKLIDFGQLRQQYANVTEFNLPFTSQQIEDVVFIGQKELVTLEYIFYQVADESKYYKLKKLAAIDQFGDDDLSNFYTFNRVPKEFQASKQDYLQSRMQERAEMKSQQQKAGRNADQTESYSRILTQNQKTMTDGKRDCKFMTVQKHDQFQSQKGLVAEALLCKWLVTGDGQLKKIKQVSFDYDHTYMQTKDGQMRLNLSQDTKVVSLYFQNPNGTSQNTDSNQLHLIAWSTQDLSQIKINPELKNNLQIQGSLVDLNLIGENSEFLLLTQQFEGGLNYKILSMSSGDTILDYTNKLATYSEKSEDNLFCMGLLFGTKQIQVQKQEEESSSDDYSSNYSEHFEEYGVEEEVVSGSSSNLDEREVQEDKQSEKSETLMEGGQATSGLVVTALFACDIDMKQGALTKKESKLAVSKYMGCVKIEYDIDEFQGKGQDQIDNQMKHDASEKVKSANQLSTPQNKLYFMLPTSWFIIKNTLQNYIQDISIKTNRNFNQFGILNSKLNCYTAIQFDDRSNSYMELDTHNKMNQRNLRLGHVRNSDTKDCLTLIMSLNHEAFAYVYPEMDHSNLVKDKKQKLTILKLTDKIETGWLDVQSRIVSKTVAGKDSKQQNKIMSGVSINKKRELCLKTIVKTNWQFEKESSIEQIQRLSKTQRIQASFPVFAYNVGLKKLIFQVSMNDNNTLVFDLPKNELFIDFLHFNTLKQLNFNPGDTNVDACSSFLFLTRMGKKMIVNLMLVDPYHKTQPFALFQSFKQWDRQERIDEIINCILYSTKDAHGSDNQTIRMLVQYQDGIDFLKMNENKNEDDIIFDSDSDLSESDSDDDLRNEKKHMSYEPVNALINQRGDVYYVTNYDGQCTIWEINSSLPDNEPFKIFEIRSNKCLGFNLFKDEFYFIDEYKVVNKLEQNMETRMLENVSDLYMKEIDKPNFVSKMFSPIIIRDKYIVYNSSIFYLYSDIPLYDGILDMEDLLEHSGKLLDFSKQKEVIFDAFEVTGSNQFALIYHLPETQQFKMQVYQLPDSPNVTLIQNEEQAISLVTFCEDGLVLLKLGNRFLLFNDCGNFLDEVEFQKKDNDHSKYRINHSQKGDIKEGFELQDGSQEAEFKGHIGVQNAISQITHLRTKYDAEMYDSKILHCLSDDSNYFLFEDKLEKKFKVYTLKVQKESKQYMSTESIIDKIRRNNLKGFNSNRVSELYEVQFAEVYSVSFKESQFRFNDDKQLTYQKLSEAVSKGQIRVTIDNNAMVSFVYCKVSYLRLQKTNLTKTIVKFSGFISIQHKSVYDGSKIVDFKQQVEFDMNPIQDVEMVIISQRSMFDNLIKIEESTQARLPERFRSRAKINSLNQKRNILNQRDKQKVSVNILGRYIVVQCGRFIKYAPFDVTNDDQCQELFQKDRFGENLEFTDLNLTFYQNIEISKIWSVNFKDFSSMSMSSKQKALLKSEDLIQIVAKDNIKNILIVVTWDCQLNKEFSIFQHKGQRNSAPENFVVRGMNDKLNYFMGEDQIIDLELRMPQQKITDNSHDSEGLGFKFQNQRKVYWNSSKFLNPKDFRYLQIPMTRMSITFWKNITDHGEDLSILKNCTQMSDFNQQFNGYSMFHYYAKELEVVRLLHSKYQTCLSDDDSTHEQLNTPLILLYPDPKGMSAIQNAIDADRPMCFEFMLDMISNFKEVPTSQMILNQLPQMIKTQSNIILKYFEQTTFHPPTLEQELKVRWPIDLPNLVFASNTILITEEQIVYELAHKYGRKYLSKSYIEDPSHQDDLVDFDNEFEATSSDNFMRDSMKKQSLSSIGIISSKVKANQLKTDKDTRKYLHQNVLPRKFEEGDKYPMKRISVTCNDFDWVFNCNTSDESPILNMQTLIEILNGDEIDNTIFKQKSIKGFVDLMWKYYRRQIVNTRFFPFIVYLIVMNIITIFGQDIIDALMVIKREKDQEISWKVFNSWTFLLILGSCIFIEVYWCWYVFTEAKELIREKWQYMKDIWNYLDFAIIIGTQLFNFQFLIDLLFGYPVFKATFVRTCGGMTLFFMWIKMFYWLRIFSKTRYFIKLIVSTIGDLQRFIYIVLVIMAAFITIFYVISCNLTEEQRLKQPYLKQYTGHRITDAIITVYFIMVGEFFVDNFHRGPNQVLLWPIFIICNFLLAVIFMNMIIAIMSQTYSEVSQTQLQSGIEQKVALISDYFDLVDIRKVFADKKYIINAEPSQTETVHKVNLEEEIEELGSSLSRAYAKQLGEVEANMKSVVKQLNSKTSQVQRDVIMLHAQIDEIKASIDAIHGAVLKDHDHQLIQDNLTKSNAN